MYKQNPNSPILKALKGNIKAAPEPVAKQTKEEASAYMDGLREKRATKAEKSGDKGRAQRIRSTKDSQDGIKAPSKQTTAGEFAHKQSIKDKEMGKSTKAVDKIKAAYDAMTTDKTYAEAKKGYRKAAKEAYDDKSPSKQTNQRVRTGTPAVPSSKRRVPPGPKVPVGPKAEKPKTKKEMLTGRANKKRYK